MHNRNKISLEEAIAVSTSVILTFLLAFATYARNTLWQDGRTLFSDAAGKSPNKARMEVALRLSDESSDETIERHLLTLRLHPDNVEARNNLAIGYKRRGLIEKAIEHYKIALQYSPGRAEIYANLGNAYDALELHDSAIECYETALKINPNYAVARYNLGITYEAKGLINEALEQYELAVKISPSFTVARERLSWLSARQTK